MKHPHTGREMSNHKRRKARKELDRGVRNGLGMRAPQSREAPPTYGAYAEGWSFGRALRAAAHRERGEALEA